MSNEHGLFSNTKTIINKSKPNQNQMNIYYHHFPPLPRCLHMDCEPTVGTYKELVSRWLPRSAYVESIIKLVGDVVSSIMLLMTNPRARCWNQYEIQTHNHTMTSSFALQRIPTTRSCNYLNSVVL